MIALLKLAAIAFLVATNGFFVASEFALVSVRRARLEARAAAGSKNAKAALRLLDNPTIFISAVQFGITLASLALGWIGEPTVARLLEPIASAIASEGRAGYVAHLMAIVIAFSVITFMHIVFGELMPKMVAVNNAIQSFLKKKKNTVFVDVYHKMLKADGTPLDDIFLDDKLHMNSKGYAIWQKEIAPFLIK